MPRIRSIRSRLLLAVLGAVALAVAAMTVGFNVVLGRSVARDADAVARARASAHVASLRTVNGRLVMGEAPDEALGESHVWIFSGGRALEAPRASPAVAAAARSLAAGPSRFLDVDPSDVRLYAAPVVSDGKRLGTVVAGVSLAPYEQTRRTALIVSLVFAGLLLAVVALAARWVLAAALRPVARMTSAAAEWSDRSLDRRFGLGDPHDELTRLAATLDSLLDRAAASLRREQRFSAELSHELRTPVARVIAEAELALRRERPGSDYRAALEVVLRNARQVGTTIEALVAAAQQEAGLARGTADALESAEQAADACSSLAVERGVTIEIDRREAPVRIGLDGDLATRILQPVLENACRYGRGRVSVSIARDASKVVFWIEDDGPGIGAGERERIFEPGVRGAAAGNGSAAGAGLGLALARRLARAASGDVEAVARERGGRFAVSLPAG